MDPGTHPKRTLEIVEQLVELGLDAEHARAYVFLSIHGPSKAATVSKGLDVPRAKAYRLLKELVDREIVIARFGRPAIYAAAEPRTVLGLMADRERRRLDAIQEAEPTITAALDALRGVPAGKETGQHYRMLQGREQIYATIGRMYARSERSVCAISTHRGALDMAELAGLLDQLIGLARKGVRVRAIVASEPRLRDRIRRLPNLPGLDFRLIDTDAMMRFVVVDDRELVVFLATDRDVRMRTPEDIALWTDAHDFVATQATLFDSLWREAEDAKAWGLTEKHRTGIER